jgi:hypothetical protein
MRREHGKRVSPPLVYKKEKKFYRWGDSSFVYSFTAPFLYYYFKSEEEEGAASHH